MPTQHGKWKIEMIEEGEEVPCLPPTASTPPVHPKDGSSTAPGKFSPLCPGPVKMPEGKVLALHKSIITGLGNNRIQVRVGDLWVGVGGQRRGRGVGCRGWVPTPLRT